MPLVLLIEDHHDIAAMVCDHLEYCGYEVDYAADGVTGLHLATTGEFDAIVLDLMLPGIDGMDICRRYRNEAGGDTPILMLTARDTLEDKVAGLDAGADDYLVKPFSPKVLLARARAVLRRTELPPDRWRPLAYQDEHLAFDLAKRQVSVRGQPVNLTRTEYIVLECLVRYADHPLPPQQILKSVWGPRYVDRVVYVHEYVNRLRQKLEPEPQNPRYLLNIPGAGYLFSTPDAEDTWS